MKKSWLWALGLSSYLVFLVCTLPAAVVLRFMPLPKDVVLGAASGTWQQGQVASVQVGPWQLPALSWQLSLSDFWRGQVGYQLTLGSTAQASQPSAVVAGRVGLSSMVLQQADVRVPIRWILPNVTLPMKMDATGDIVVNVTEFSSGQPYCASLQGTASWQDARFQSPIGWLDLQSIQGALSCQQGNLQLVTAANNALGAALTVDLLADRYQINGTLQPASTLPREVHQAMQFVGPQDSQGRYVMQLAGQIR